jgi:hypothetical protein
MNPPTTVRNSPSFRRWIYPKTKPRRCAAAAAAKNRDDQSTIMLNDYRIELVAQTCTIVES